MTILDRTTRPRIRFDPRRLADSLARSLPKVDARAGFATPGDARGGVDRAARAASEGRENAGDAIAGAADRAGSAVAGAADQAATVVADAADTIRHGIDRAVDTARGLRDDLAASAARGARDVGLDDLGGRLHVDELGQRLGVDEIGHRLDELGRRLGIDDLAQRIRLDELGHRLTSDDLGARLRAAASPATFRAAVARLERELPDTDKDRYDRAFARGRARARSAYLVVGVAAGIGVGVAAAFLLDPKHGPARRASIKARTSRLTQGLGRTVAGKAKFASDRARGLAIEKGLVQPDASPVAPPDVSLPGSGGASAGLVAVGPGRAGLADGSVSLPVDGVVPAEPPVMPIADGPITDPSSTLREPLPEEGGAPSSPTPAAEVAAAASDASLAEHDRTATPSSHG